MEDNNFMEGNNQAESRSSFSAHTMKAGLAIGLILVFEFIASLSTGVVSTLIVYALELAAIVAAWKYAKTFRDKENEGLMSWGQAFAYIFCAFFYGSLIAALARFIYSQWINPEYIASMTEQVLDILESSAFDLTDEMVDVFNKTFRPINIALLSIMGECISGAFWGAILGLFLRKKEEL